MEEENCILTGFGINKLETIMPWRSSSCTIPISLDSGTEEGYISLKLRLL